MSENRIVQRILIVDDEPSIRKALTWGLASDAVEVEVAENGAAGVLLGTSKRYDVIIVDLCLPDIGGLEVVRKIKDRSTDTVAIMITGKPNDSSRDRADAGAVSAYLEKPLQLQVVKDAIRQGIMRRDLDRD